MHNISLAETIGRPAIARVVDSFYLRVRAHPTLSTPFAHVADWPLHQERLAHFWWVALGGDRYADFHYHVTAKHFTHGFTQELLADWLALFEATLFDLLPTHYADTWLALAHRMGGGLATAHDHLAARLQENSACLT